MLRAFERREFGLGSADWGYEDLERTWYEADDRVIVEIRERSWLRSAPADVLDQRTPYEGFVARHRAELPKFTRLACRAGRAHAHRVRRGIPCQVPPNPRMQLDRAGVGRGSTRALSSQWPVSGGVSWCGPEQEGLHLMRKSLDRRHRSSISMFTRQRADSDCGGSLHSTPVWYEVLAPSVKPRGLSTTA